MEKITTWLWFDTEAEEAARFSTSISPDSRITDVLLYAGSGAAGPVMTVSFELNGTPVRRPERRPEEHRSAAPGSRP